MGVNISDYLRTALLNHALGVAVSTSPTTVWAALYTTPPPSSAGGGTEVSAADYHRIATQWNVASLGETNNLADIRFPATGLTLSNWGTVSGLGLFDAPTGGHLLFFGLISAPVLMQLGSEFDFPPSALAISLS